MEKSTTKLKYHTRRKVITDQYLQVILIDVQSVATLLTMKALPVQPINIKVKYAINLGTLQANVYKRNNNHITNTDSPRHTKYRLMKYMIVQTVTHQKIVKIHSVYK